MQHVTRMQVTWPIKKKREHIVATADCAWMLVPNTPMVVMRRFSPKEDLRRVTAAAYTGGVPGAAIGLENHLNYIYRPGGIMAAEEALGLAAYLNSNFVDAHFRAVAGSTQVNATELRKLPIPTTDALVAIGKAYRPGMSLSEVDQIVEIMLGLKHPELVAA
jgi:adenine-specific DNA-methyltransferase